MILKIIATFIFVLKYLLIFLQNQINTDDSTSYNKLYEIVNKHKSQVIPKEKIGVIPIRNM